MARVTPMLLCLTMLVSGCGHDSSPAEAWCAGTWEYETNWFWASLNWDADAGMVEWKETGVLNPRAESTMASMIQNCLEVGWPWANLEEPETSDDDRPLFLWFNDTLSSEEAYCRGWVWHAGFGTALLDDAERRTQLATCLDENWLSTSDWVKAARTVQYP